MTSLRRAEEMMESCDAARNTWYSQLLRRQFNIVPAFDEATLNEIAWVRELARDEEAPLGESYLVAMQIEQYFSYPMIEGVVLGKDGEPLRLHSWNILPHCAILDASYDLISGNPGEVKIFKSSDPEWKRYRKEWTPEYNPELSHRYPELSGIQWNGQFDMQSLSAISEKMTFSPVF